MNELSLIQGAVSLALEINLRRQEAAASVRHAISPKIWIYEFATVHVRLGRGAGHTSAIKHFVRENDLIICGVKSQKQLFWRTDNSPVPKIKVATTLDFEFEPDRFRGLTFDRIWVDDASNLSESELVLIYDLALRRKVSQIVMLG